MLVSLSIGGRTATEEVSSGLGGSSLGEEEIWLTSSVITDLSPRWSDIQEGKKSAKFSKSPTSVLLDIHYELIIGRRD